ncbi:hypothetical protein GCM10009721_08910 [Terrabacter tumescens]|uniref:DUF2029 domain-containing protein n=1 Tax=Terrabacter tumescens TaxID=60443 RepID=A0ABQ2HMY1_9MICO|nr:hypothetical protein [Terrabacter tumescens]GGM86345.1 hypothetical protein GCM10009721_08910 [Terrabacter tumescens]
MTTQTQAPAPTRARLLPSAPPRRYLVPATLAVAFLVTQAVAQAVTPFIRQDDWPFLLPDGTKGVLPPAYYNSSEGRWLNTLWWQVVGQHGTPTTASMTYAVGYLALVAGLWRLLHLSGIRPRPVADVLLGLALYASAVWVQLLYWPGALTPSVLVAAAAAWLLPWAARSRVRLGLWLLVAEAAAVMTYPPVGVVLLVFTVVHLRESPWRRVLSVIAAWVAAFAVGVAISYTLNWLVYGHFGLDLPAWRQSNPMTSVDAFVTNAGRWLSATGAMWAAQWWVAAVGLVAVVLGWRDRAVRPRLQRLLVVLAVACGLDAAQTLATGIVTEARGQLWTWLVALLPVALLLLDRPRDEGDAPEGAHGIRHPRIGHVATALLAVLAVAGVLSWRADIGAHQATRMEFAAIAEQATAHAPGTTVPTIVLWQDPAARNSRDGRLIASTMVMAVREQTGGILPRMCRGQECIDLSQLAAAGPVVRLDVPGGSGHVVAIIMPPTPGWV